MAAGSDLLDEVFLNTEVDEKVVSDLVGSLESQLAASGHHHQHHKAQEPLRAAGGLLGNHVVSGGSGSGSPSPSPGGVVVGGSANAQTESGGGGGKMGLSAPEITKAGTVPCRGQGWGRGASPPPPRSPPLRPLSPLGALAPPGLRGGHRPCGASPRRVPPPPVPSRGSAFPPLYFPSRSPEDVLSRVWGSVPPARPCHSSAVPSSLYIFFPAPSVGGVESAQPTRGVTAVPRGPGLPPTSPPSPLNLLLQRWGLRRESLSVVPPPRSAGGVINHDIYFLQRRKPGRGDFEGRKSLGTLPPTRCFSSAPSPPVGGSEGRSAPPVPALPSRGGWCHRVGRGGSGRRDPAWGCALSVCGGAGTEGSPLGNGGKLVCGGIVIATTIKKSPQNLSAIPPLPPFLYFILLCFFSSR